MSDIIKISTELAGRIHAIAARTNLTADDIVSEALNGRSLEWHEEYLRRVDAGIEAAELGKFASADEVDAVFNKYRQS